MKTSTLFRVEFGRMMHERITWIMIALVVLSPAMGIRILRLLPSMSAESYSSSMNVMYIGNLAMAGAFCSTILFAFFTARQLSNIYIKRVDKIIFSVVSEAKLLVCRTMVLLAFAVLLQVVTIILWLPYTWIQLGAIFRLDWMLEFYSVLMLPAMVFTILIASAGFNITKRFDLSMILPIVLLVLNITVWASSWLLRIFLPVFTYIQDDFGNQRRLQSLAYNRLVWILITSGVWLLTCLCIRKYERSLFYSIFRNLRKVYLPLLSAALIFSGIYAAIHQPMLDHSIALIDYDKEYNFAYMNVACKSIHVEAKPQLSNGSFYGTATYQLHNPSAEETAITFWLTPGYQITKATANGVSVNVTAQKEEAINKKVIELTIPAEKEIELVLEYGGYPQEWNICETFQGNTEISKDYVIMENELWLPTIRNFNLNRTKDEFMTVDIDLPEDMTAVQFGTGTCERVGTPVDGLQHWKLTNSNDYMILYAGDYVCDQIQTKDLNINFYYSAQHRDIMEKYQVDDVIKEVFNYCTEHYGSLHFDANGTLSIVEMGTSGGGYAGDGTSSMGEESFNEASLKNTLKGNGGREVLIHEIVHQWWGLAQQFEEDIERGWSSEGLTVFTTYRILKEERGQEYTQEFCIDRWQDTVDDYYQNFYVRNPEYFDQLPEKYQATIYNSFSGMKKYNEIPLKILKAEQLLGGEEQLDAVLYKLFQADRNWDNGAMSYEDFLNATNLTEEDLNLE